MLLRCIGIWMQVQNWNNEWSDKLKEEQIINALPEGTLRRRHIESNKPAKADSGTSFFNSKCVLRVKGPKGGKKFSKTMSLFSTRIAHTN